MIALALSACSDDSSYEYPIGQNQDPSTRSDSVTYEGDWIVNVQFGDSAVYAIGTVMRNGEKVNEQAVDMAYQEASNTLTVLFPEKYLASLWRRYANVSPTGIPAVLKLQAQGYTENLRFCTCSSAVRSWDNVAYYVNGSCCVDIDTVRYRIELLSAESGTAMYRLNPELWTMGIPFENLLVTNLQTNEEHLFTLSASFTLYFSSKKRI